MIPINQKLTNSFSAIRAFAVGLAGLVMAVSSPSAAQPVPLGANPAGSATYADLVTLAETSEMVIRVEIRRQTTVRPERAPGLAPGFARLYIEARTLALIAGPSALGESLVYLVDVPLDARGKVPKLKDREMLLFADGVPGDRGSIQLTGPASQLEYTPELEARLRPILMGLVASDNPPQVTGIADALAVPGTLAGESETQIFLRTENNSPVSLTVLRRPGQRPVWGVSWGEIIDSSARAPQPETLRWYRLACFLPSELPPTANLASDAAARRLAAQDYAFVVRELGPCERVLTS